jgi:hypothetical protein
LKKRLNKIVAFAIGISVMSLSVVPAFGKDITQNANNVSTVQTKANQKPVLTLAEAIKAAINISEVLELDEKKINYMDKINDINEKIDDNPQLIGKAEIDMPESRKDFNKDTRDIKLKQCKEQKDFDEDKLIQKVTTIYNNIVTSQMKIEEEKRQIELKTKELSIAKVKNASGVITELDLNGDELKIEDLKDKLKSNENGLKDVEYNFEILTGKDIAGYSLEQDIEFNKFKVDGSIDDYLDEVVEKYLKYSTKLIELNKDYFNDKDNKVEDVKDEDKPSDKKPTLDTTGDNTAGINNYAEYQSKLDGYYQKREMYTFKLSMRLAYLNAKLGTYEGETNLNEAKKQFKEQLRTFYTNLVTMEDNINLLKKNIVLTNKQLSILKVKYDDGLITKTDYDNQVVNSEDLDIQLRNAIDRYNTLKEQIQKPWIAFSK